MLLTAGMAGEGSAAAGPLAEQIGCLAGAIAAGSAARFIQVPAGLADTAAIALTAHQPA